MGKFRLRNTLLWWLPLALLASLTILLVVAERELQIRIDQALATERMHIGRARSAREEAQKTYVALLQRWIRPASLKAEGSKQVAQNLARMRTATDSFVTLEPLSQIEGQARATLVVSLALFANRVQKALINEDGPAAIAEINEYNAAIDAATNQVLTIDSAAGQVSDTQVLTLRRNSGLAIAGLVLVGAGASGLAFVWWLMKRRSDRRYRAAETARCEQERAAAMRARFFAHLSHELRTPIIVIQNLTAELREVSQVSVAKRIRQAADELLHGINNILDFSKLEIGRQSMRIEAIDIRDVIRRSVHRCEGLVGTKNVEIVVDIAQDLPMIAGDIVKLYQVFTNLIANAIKFTDQGQIVVSAALCSSASIRIEVKDSGIGIAEQALARIWQPFEQADDAISSRFGGTGLGLSLAKALIELHKGTVGVNSKLGEGACFWVTLPIAQIAAAA